MRKPCWKNSTKHHRREETNNAYYTLGAKKILSFLENNDRKSIPFSYIEKYGIKIKEGFIPPLDYIKSVDILIKEMDYEKNK